MKRFWQAVTVVDDGRVLLDARPVRTPGQVVLRLPTAPLAAAVAAEWSAAGETLDPRAMPLTGIANAAVDRVAPDPVAFAATLARYGESDLLLYRADGPDTLVNLQRAAWDPPLAWARQRYDVAFAPTAGVIHRAQPPATLARLREATTALSPFALAALSPLVTITGSLVLALMMAERAVAADQAWAAAHVDEDWQAERWGADQLAASVRVSRRCEYDAAARFLDLLG